PARRGRTRGPVRLRLRQRPNPRRPLEAVGGRGPEIRVPQAPQASGAEARWAMTLDAKLADDIAAATAAYGMIELATCLSADRHEELRELRYDLAFSALVAYADFHVWRAPECSPN